jgi:hypothetical protein
MSKPNGKLLGAMLVIALCACARGTLPADAASPKETAKTLAPSNKSEPPLGSMKVATAVGKTGAPVEVRYEPTGKTMRGQPTILKLAFVPQIAGADLAIEFPASDAVTIDSALSRLSVSNAQRDGVYRRSLFVTPQLADDAELRVMVWVEAEGGRFFSIFTIPVGK